MVLLMTTVRPLVRVLSEVLACLHAQLQEEAALHEQYTRVITPEPGLNEETEDVCALLEECYLLRYSPQSCHA